MLALTFALAAALRIVSLSPPLTEDLFAIGAGAQVVGVDFYSNRPDAVNALPHVGRMNAIDTEKVLALHPDLVVGNTPGESPMLNDLRRAGLNVESVPVETLTDEFTAIERLGVLTGRAAQAHAFAVGLHGRLDAISARAKRLRPLRAYVAVERAPLYTAAADSYIGALLGMANLVDIVPAQDKPFPVYSAEQLVAQQPDVVVCSDRSDVFTGAPWDQLSAIRAGRIARIPTDDLDRAGPYVDRALDELVRSVAAWR